MRRGLAVVTSRRNAAHYVLGRAVGLVLVVLGVTVCAVSAKQTALAAGYAGTRGTYTVGQCHERYQAGGGGRHVGRTVTCTGTFRADGGVGPAGGADAPEGGFGTFHPDTVYRPGARVPVQTGDGVTFTAAGWPQAWGAAAGVFLALPMLAAGTFCLLTGFGARWGRSFGDSWDGLPGGAVLRPLLLSVAGVGILGAAVFFFLQHYG
ncbi:hypothetical protein ACH4OW_27065 [Streptomyces sp. NPDC017056]|uniref:hypothetical protein n=1 Tax=Streptomyces sp. NPDC017056 TaxID=3364973 RepID=UPI0037B2C255